MLQIKSFIFSPFQENTYLLYDDETHETVIIDPGCYSQEEKMELKAFIEQNKLKPKSIFLTHAHLDHVFGVAFCKRIFNIEMHMHTLEQPILADVENRCKVWGIPGYEPCTADHFYTETSVLSVGKYHLSIVHVPGHAPGHVAFISKDIKSIIGGDCLFYQSIGRTDFPGCSHTDLIRSIKSQFFILPEEYIVYAGHMQPTTIGHEKRNNPFLKA
jgi:hydroxyacylglutathione hydrolase